VNARLPLPAPVVWRFAGREFDFLPAPGTAPLIMGIVNTTPDSFSDGGEFLDPDRAIEHALQLVADGADIIDLGGESTRPGAEPVPEAEELRRVLPVVEKLRGRTTSLISIDTCKAEVARQAVAAGADIINDVTALAADPAMIDVAAACDAGIIIMHMRGTPKTMQQDTHYDDVVAEVRSYLAERLDAIASRGVARQRIAVDPGIGFAKTARHNRQLIRKLHEIGSLRRPICLGPSRKAFIGQLLNRPIDQRLFGTIGAAIAGYLLGANILRIHDVAAVGDAIRVLRAIEYDGDAP